MERDIFILDGCVPDETDRDDLYVWCDASSFPDDASDLPNLSAPIMRLIEPVGTYFERALADDLFGHLNNEQSRHARGDASRSAKATPVRTSNRKDAPSSAGKSVSSKRQVVLKEDELQEEWYEVLGISAKGESSTFEEVRAAYRLKCLETHPDKHGGSDVGFKKVQRAFEILGDADAKRVFDCSRPFDDSVPEPADVSSDTAYYREFAATFLRNARWSNFTPVPDLGDDSTPLADVRRFYDFWLSFSSWRDFSHDADLEEVNEDMMRYEKRFIARENERQLEKLRRLEVKRIRTLTEMAMKMDPRLRRQREEEEKAKAEAAAKKAAEIRRREEEEALRVQRELERQEEARRKQKEELERKKSLLRDGYKTLLDFFTSAGSLDAVDTNLLVDDKVRKPNLQWLVQKTTPDDIVSLLERITKAVNPVKTFNEEVLAAEQRCGMTRYGEPVQATGGSPTTKTATKEVAPPSSPAAVWLPEDVSNLRKAISKFPPGTVERWRRIATALRDKFTEEQVLAKTKELEQFGNSVAAPSSTAPSTTPATAAPPGVAHADPTGGPSVAPPSTLSMPPPLPGAPKDNVEDWTAKQQKQLETGLRDLKDYKEKDKFIKIAAFVEGKTAAQCFDRFKYVAGLMKKK